VQFGNQDRYAGIGCVIPIGRRVARNHLEIRGGGSGERHLQRFAINGNNQTLGTVTNAGTITSTTGTPTLSIVSTSSGSGVYAGSLALFANAVGGTVTLSGASTYSGNTTVNAGTLALSFSTAGAPTTNIINNTADTSPLIMSGFGTLTLTGKAGLTNSQQFPSLTLSAEAAPTIGLTGAATGSIALSLGTITRNAGATLNFVAIPLTTGTTVTITGVTGNTGANGNDLSSGGGILGTWVTGANSTYLQANSSGQLVAYAGATAAAAPANLTDTTGLVNYNLAAGSVTGLTSSFSMNTIRYTGAATGVLDIGTGASNSNTLTVNGIMGIRSKSQRHGMH